MVRRRRAGTAGAILAAITVIASGAAVAEVSPEYTDWMRIGRAAYKADDFAAAEAAFKLVLQAARTPRQRATANGYLAMTAEQLKRLDAARAYAREALRHFPEEGRATAVLGRLR